MAIKCRPNSICEFIDKLSDEQREAVREIGFGGLLSLGDLCGAIPWTKFNWFFSNFNTKSRVLQFPNGKVLVLTDETVRDIFLIPCVEGRDVLLIDNDIPECTRFLNDFKKRFSLSTSVCHSKLKDLMLDDKMKDGGADFKRLFVLFSFSCFLGATSNMKIDFSILRSLMNVDLISSFNWCKLVIERVCRGLQNFPRSNIGGCVLVIPIMYFHHFMWLGECSPCSLPLIKHWTSESIKHRIECELEVGNFGIGKWVEGVYPISSKTLYAEAEPKAKSDELDAHTDLEEDEHWIKFKLPAEEKTNKDIKAISCNDMQEACLIFQRDLSVVMQYHMGKLKKLKEDADDEGKKATDCRPSSSQLSTSSKVDDLDEFYSKAFLNPDFVKQVNVLEQIMLDNRNAVAKEIEKRNEKEMQEKEKEKERKEKERQVKKKDKEMKRKGRQEKEIEKDKKKQQKKKKPKNGLDDDGCPSYKLLTSSDEETEQTKAEEETKEGEENEEENVDEETEQKDDDTASIDKLVEEIDVEQCEKYLAKTRGI